MAKPNDYTILRAANPMKLEEKVRDGIRQGWIPSGGVGCRAGGKLDDEYLQAMIKE